MHSDMSPDQSIEERFDTEVTGRRILAALIDFVPLTILLIIMTVLLGETETIDGAAGSSSTARLTGWPFVLFLILALVYYTVLEAVTGKTIGKAMMHLEIITDYYGTRPKLSRDAGQESDVLDRRVTSLLHHWSCGSRSEPKAPVFG